MKTSSRAGFFGFFCFFLSPRLSFTQWFSLRQPVLNNKRANDIMSWASRLETLNVLNAP